MKKIREGSERKKETTAIYPEPQIVTVTSKGVQKFFSKELRYNR
jgi:hypothetical protein